MDTLSKKIEKLQKKKESLALELSTLIEERNKELMKVLEHLKTESLHPYTLIGGLLHVASEAKKNPEAEETWRKAGEKFRRRYPASSASKTHSKAA